MRQKSTLHRVVRGPRPRHSAGDSEAPLRRGEDPHRARRLARRNSIAELCRREGIAEGIYLLVEEFSRRASAGLPETPHVRQRPMRSSSSGARRRT